MKSQVGTGESQPKEYTKKRNFVNFFLVLFLVFSWFPEIMLFQAPIVAISLSMLIASVGVFLLSLSQFRMDRRYKHVTATEKDYLVLNIPLYLMALPCYKNYVLKQVGETARAKLILFSRFFVLKNISFPSCFNNKGFSRIQKGVFFEVLL